MTFWLVGLVVLIGLAVPFAAFVPVATCPDCGWMEFTSDSAGYVHHCKRCRDTRRITILDKWLHPRRFAPPDITGPSGEPLPE